MDGEQTLVLVSGLVSMGTTPVVRTGGGVVVLHAVGALVTAVNGVAAAHVIPHQVGGNGLDGGCRVGRRWLGDDKVFLLGVPALVFVEIGRIAEAARAQLALERPVAGVHAHVYLQAAGAEERLEAHVALVLLLASVLHEVRLQRRGLRERRVALVALERLFNDAILRGRRDDFLEFLLLSVRFTRTLLGR